MKPAFAAAVALGFAAGGAPVRAQAAGDLDLKGYLESLQSGAFADDLDSVRAGNLLRNRLELRWTPSSRPEFATDLVLRNGLYYGDWLQDPNQRASLGRDPGWLDLNILPVDQAGAVLSLAVARAWAEWNAGHWKLTAGRQRINWGMASAWNPNDLFNAYDVLDFDDEERPGSDAMRLLVSPSSSPVQFDLAAKADGSARGAGALRLGWNAWETDFQVLGGWFHDRAVAGAGWAGNLGQAGFKGEASWFSAATGNGKGSLSATLSLDYALAEGTNVSASVLRNGGSGGGLSGWFASSGTSVGRSPDNLFPAEWAVLAQANRPFSLVLTGGTTVVLAPDLDAVLAAPTLDWNFSENWDLDLLWQTLVAYGNSSGWNGTGLRSLANSGRLRVRRTF
jgi:hypothetical protein